MQDYLTGRTFQPRVVPIGLTAGNGITINLAIQGELFLIQPFKADVFGLPFAFSLPYDPTIRHTGIKWSLNRILSIKTN